MKERIETENAYRENVQHQVNAPIERNDNPGGNRAGNSGSIEHQCDNRVSMKEWRRIEVNPKAGVVPNKLVQGRIDFRNGSLKIISHKTSHSGSELPSQRKCTHIKHQKGKSS